jgi:isoquinoline 1-oxidoreductase beta subunit
MSRVRKDRPPHLPDRVRRHRGRRCLRRLHGPPPPPTRLQDGLAEGAATFNPWVLIDGERVTLITPHADKGQGVVSSQAALIAEELDIEFGQFETSFGPPSAAYWNTAMAEEAVPFRSTDEGFAAETMRDVAGGALKLLGLQAHGRFHIHGRQFRQAPPRRCRGARDAEAGGQPTQTGIPVGQLTTAQRRCAPARRNANWPTPSLPRPPRGWSP